MTDNIIDFNKSLDKKILNNFKEIADMVIDECFANGNNDVELASNLLSEIRVTDGTEELRSTMLSMTIETIERKGYWSQANKLRELLYSRLDHKYEKILDIMRSRNSETIDKETVMKVLKDDSNDVETYDDAEQFLDDLTKEEQSRIEATIKKVFADEIDFSSMNEKEAYEVLKDCAKYSFYCGILNMNKLVLDNKNFSVSLTFREGFPLLDESKNAFAYLVNVFDEVWITKNPKAKTLTANFCFYNFKKGEN